jgi:two-component system, OmpR family, phosphate regulon sensor histidine kinase PhoR
MPDVNTVALVINGLTIALALIMLILILWQDSRSGVNLFFAILMGMIVIWSAGSLLGRIIAYAGTPSALTAWGVRLMEIGFTGTCVSLYLFTVMVTGGQGRMFVRIAIVGMALLLAYQAFLAFSTTTPAFEIRDDGTLRHSFSVPATIIYGSFVVITVFVTWQQQRKIRDRAMLVGIYGLSLGMFIELTIPELRAKSIGMDISACSSLILSYSLVRAQIIEPLTGRANQLRAVRDVGLAITSRLRLEEVLSTIAAQAAGILQADGAAIFLSQGGALELAAVHNMPTLFLGQRLVLGEGLAGKSAATRQVIRVDDYRRDWDGVQDMPFAKQSFGAVIAAPLVFAGEVMGVLVVVEGPQGRRFDREDMRLVDLLGPQAAVAITNSRLFERQQALTGELEAAKTQLETVLTSTENPVIAVNRRLQIIFANPAAAQLFDQWDLSGRSVRDLTPHNLLPLHPTQALRELRRKRVFVYELTVQDRTYLCHVALLGRARPQGYVAILNDISQLKELDRLKSQMIRMTSHDLKNPLSAAMFHVELLQEEGDNNFTEEIRNDINTIWIQLQRMNRIISGILDLERVQSGSLTYEECSVHQIIQFSANELTTQATRKGVTVQVDIPDQLPTITGDRHQLIQAMNNLIENAVKFTTSGGRVTVKAEQVEEHVVIHVADSGIGIPVEAQPRVFERFFRAYHPGSEQITGTGLGLSLVKSVVDAHNGRIWLESEINKGTTVHLLLPARQVGNAETRKDEQEKSLDLHPHGG